MINRFRAELQLINLLLISCTDNLYFDNEG